MHPIKRMWVENKHWCDSVRIPLIYQFSELSQCWCRQGSSFCTSPPSSYSWWPPLITWVLFIFLLRGAEVVFPPTNYAWQKQSWEPNFHCRSLKNYTEWQKSPLNCFQFGWWHHKRQQNWFHGFGSVNPFTNLYPIFCHFKIATILG